MVNKDQIADCLSRGWITVSLEHRLCPQVNILEGPITDCRDALAWVYDDDGLNAELSKNEPTSGFTVDKDRVMAFGTSSGGAIALALVSFPSPHPPTVFVKPQTPHPPYLQTAKPKENPRAKIETNQPNEDPPPPQ